MELEEFLEQVEAVIDGINVESASETELRHAMQSIAELVESTEEEEDDEDEDEDDEDQGLEVEDDEDEDEEV